MEKTKIKLWGNCPSIRIGRHDMSKANFKVGDTLSVSSEDGKIILKKSTPMDLEELFNGKIKEYPCQEEDWGAPKGTEIW